MPNSGRISSQTCRHVPPVESHFFWQVSQPERKNKSMSIKEIFLTSFLHPLLVLDRLVFLVPAIVFAILTAVFVALKIVSVVLIAAFAVPKPALDILLLFGCKFQYSRIYCWDC